METDISVRVRTAGDWTHVTVGGEVDLLTAPTLKRRLRGAIEDGARRLLVDLGDVTFLDSSGLGALAAASSRVRENGGTLELVCTARAVLRALEITGLDRVLPVHASAVDVLGDDA